MTTLIMRKRFGWWNSLLWVVSLPQVAFAASLSLACPDFYPGKNQMAKLSGGGWQVALPGVVGRRLSESGVLLGSHDADGVLRGSDLPDGSGRVFHFEGDQRDHEKWLYCSYSGTATGRLVFRLPVEMARCEVKEMALAGRLQTARFVCR